MIELREARVLVTGASRGIGRALAEGFAAKGSRVAVLARDGDALRDLADRLGGVAYAVDLSQPDAAEGLIARIERDGPVDVLVNNAGVSTVKFVLEHRSDEVERIMRVNLLAAMRLSIDAARAMLERGHGHIVNMSSMGGVLVPPGLAAYVASKAGLSAFTAALRHELRGLPVGVTLVELGSVATEMDARSRSYAPIKALADRSKGRDIVPMPVVVDAIVDAVARGRAHVRLPRQLAMLPAMVEAPRRLTRWMFRTVEPRAESVGGEERVT